MKSTSASLLTGLATVALWAAAVTPAGAFVYENDLEFLASGDFDGDSRADLVIIDKASGKYRLGYQLSNGVYSWKEFRVSGLKYISGVGVGRVFDAKRDALAFTAKDSGGAVVVDAGNPSEPSPPVTLEVEVQGPNLIATIDIGGAGNTPVPDVYLSSVYNADPENQATLFRNNGGKFAKISDLNLAGAPVSANVVALKEGSPEVLGLVLNAAGGAKFEAQTFASGKPQVLASAGGLPAGATFTVGHFRGSPLLDLVFYKFGGSSVIFKPVEESGGSFAIGEGKTYDLGKPIKQVLTLAEGKVNRLLVIFGEGDKGESAGVFDFDGANAPKNIATVNAKNKEDEPLSGAGVVPNGFLLFSRLKSQKYSTKYQFCDAKGGTNATYVRGGLPTLQDSDVVTVPEIQKRILATLTEKTAADMKPYTNTIPGTAVKYSLMPIPGGEFTMGSPASEAGRKPDESPQHKVKIAPFWMGKCEVTWNEFELFVYKEDEIKLRETYPTDAEVNKVVDAVARPSRPYVEMSFGMGREGYPAIAMTHHAAAKYCHWLSAKTGHFYRLPTEAEWEYACRAGTTTAYSFGDDPAELEQYAWFEDNADFKYHKVGKKKPNPWGLFDMHGNVLEWCLDQYEPNYDNFASGADNPWVKPKLPYPHSARGGSYDDQGPVLRSAARRGSDRTWKMTDPQLPKSVWWLSDSKFVGFRLVRPLAVPPVEEMNKVWNIGTEKE